MISGRFSQMSGFVIINITPAILFELSIYMPVYANKLEYISYWPEVYPQLLWSILDSLSGRKCLFQRA